MSTGISIKKELESELKKEAPFDASIIVHSNNKTENLDTILNKINFRINENENYATCTEYLSNMQFGSSSPNSNHKNYEASFITISDYNKMLKLKGQKEINLNRNEVLLMSNYNKLVKLANKKLNNSNKVTIKDKEYLVKNHKIIDYNLATYIMPNNNLTIVINDEFLCNYNNVNKSILNIMYSDKNRESNNKKYSKIYQNSLNDKYKNLNISELDAFTKDDLYSTNKGSTTVILFIGLYLGIIFLIASMAILALQQLSEASHSIERYKTLRKIGANKQMIYKTIFTQTLIYFSLPVMLALIHSIIGITVINNEILKSNQIDIKLSSLLTALLFIAVYIIYFYTTYTGYKNIVKNSI